MLTEFQEDQEVADRVLVQPDSTAIIAGYNSDGWVVEHRVDADGRDPDAVFEEAMFQVQGEQGRAVVKDAQIGAVDSDSPEDI